MSPKKQRDKRGRRRGRQSRPKSESVRKNLSPPIVGSLNHVKVQGSLNHVKVLSENQPVLERCTHINIQVISSLWATDVIKYSLKEALVADKDLFNRFQLCYNHLRKNPTDVFNKFILVMKGNEQKHVANLLEGCNQGQPPMSQKNYDRLKNVCPVLIGKIVDDVCELAIILNRRRESSETDTAISEVELEEIQKKTSTRERNYSLISAVLRRTDYSFQCLREALFETLHGHLVKYMDEGWVIGAHVETTHPDSDEILAKSFNEQLDLVDSEQTSFEDERPVREELKDLSVQNIPCAFAEPGHSIMVYTYCRTADDLRKYVQMFRSRRLHSIMNDVFGRLFRMTNPHSPEILQAKITIPETFKEIIENVTGICEFSVADADVGKSLGTDDLQKDANRSGKDYSATDAGVGKSLDAEVLHDDNVTISNNNSSCDVDVNRPLGIDALKENAVKAGNDKPESTTDIVCHMTLPPPLIGLVLTKPSAEPFQNVGATPDARQPNPNSKLAIMSQQCENKRKRSPVMRHSQPRTKVRKKEMVPFSRWTETSHARKNCRKQANSHQLPVQVFKGRSQPKEPDILQKLLCKDMINGKHPLLRSLSLTHLPPTLRKHNVGPLLKNCGKFNSERNLHKSISSYLMGVY